MSYLDPIRAALETSRPIPHGGLKAIAQLFAIACIPFSVLYFAIEQRWNLSDLPLPYFLDVILALAAGWGALVAVFILLAFLVQGVPETLAVIQGHCGDYIRRNVVGYTVQLNRHDDGSIDAQLHRNGELLDYGAEGTLMVPLGGWFRTGGYWIRNGKRACRVRLASYNHSTGALTIRVRLTDGVFTGEAKWFLDLFHDGVSPNVYWAEELRWYDLVRYLHTKLGESTDMLKTLSRLVEEKNAAFEAERRRADQATDNFESVVRMILESKRFQHSKEAERILLQALEQLIPFLDKDGSKRLHWEREFYMLRERIAMREIRAKSTAP